MASQVVSALFFVQGNVNFIPDEKQNEQARVKNNDTVGVIAKLLASSEDELEKALCYRVVAARGEVVEKGHSVKEAMYARDAFAKVDLFVVSCTVRLDVYSHGFFPAN